MSDDDDDQNDDDMEENFEDLLDDKISILK